MGSKVDGRPLCGFGLRSLNKGDGGWDGRQESQDVPRDAEVVGVASTVGNSTTSEHEKKKEKPKNDSQFFHRMYS